MLHLNLYGGVEMKRPLVRRVSIGLDTFFMGKQSWKETTVILEQNFSVRKFLADFQFLVYYMPFLLLSKILSYLVQFKY